MGPRPRAGAGLRAGSLALVTALTIAAAGCGGAAREPLAGARENPAAVAHAVLAAVADRDAAALRALALSEHEFRMVLWPVLPASRPEANVPFEYAWGTLSQNSSGYLASHLREHGGRRYTLAQIDFTGERTRHGDVVVHRGSRLVVRDDAGRERRLSLFGSLVERDGEFKIVSYVAD